MNPAEEYILAKPEPIKNILLTLSFLVEDTLKNNFELKFSYRIPFYYYKGKTFCYLNHPKNKDFIELSFIKGRNLSHRLLISDGRKMVKSLRFSNEKDIDGELVSEIVLKASILY